MNALSTLMRIRELLALLQDDSLAKGSRITDATAYVLSEVRRLAALEPIDDAFATPARDSNYLIVEEAVDAFEPEVELPESPRGWGQVESPSDSGMQRGGGEIEEDEGPTALGTHGGGGGIDD
jgi:hypothetical protein